MKKKITIRSSSESILSSRLSNRADDIKPIKKQTSSKLKLSGQIAFNQSPKRSPNISLDKSNITNNDYSSSLKNSKTRELRTLSTPINTSRITPFERGGLSSSINFRPANKKSPLPRENPSETSKRLLYDMYLKAPSNQREEIRSSQGLQLTDRRIEAVKSMIESNFSKKISLPDLYWREVNSGNDNNKAGAIKINGGKNKGEENLGKVLCMLEENHKILKRKKSFSGDRVLLACDIPVRLTPKQAKIDENYNIQSLVKSMSSKGEKVENAIEYNISLRDFQKYLEKSRDIIKKGIDPSKKMPDSKQVRTISSKQRIIQLIHQTTKRANKFEESQLSIINDID